MDFNAETLEKYQEDTELIEAFEMLSQTEKAYGIESDQFVQALGLVGSMLNERGDYLEALGYFIRGRSVLEVREEQLHPLMSDLLAGIGEHYLLQGMLVEALPYYEKSLSVRDALCIGGNSDSARLHMKAGEIQLMQGELLDAKEHMVRAYQILSESDPENYSVLGDICNNLGLLLHTEEQHERAVESLLKACEYREKYFGSNSTEHADSRWILGKAYQGLGDDHKSLENLYTSIVIKEELHGSEDPQVLKYKEEYRSLSGGVESIATSDAVVRLTESVSDVNSQHNTQDSELAYALISAALLAMQKKQDEVAMQLLEISKGCIGHKEIVDPTILEKLMTALTPQK